MRILFYAHSSTLYGANRSLVELIKGLLEFDSEIKVRLIIPSSGPITSELEKMNIDYRVIPSWNWIYDYRIAENWRIRNNFLQRIWFYKNKFQKELLNQIFRSSHLKEVKNFKPDLIYINSTLAPMGLVVAEKTGTKFVWHHRETVEDPITSYFLNSTERFLKYYEKAKIHFYASKFLKSYYESKFGVQPSLIVKNGIKEITGQKKQVFNPDRIRFGIVGRINFQKRPLEVVTVFDQLKKENNAFLHELHIFGGGEEKLLTKLRGNKNQGVLFHNFSSRSDVYDNIDVLILNSINEAYGRVVVEANSVGIPVLAKNSGALPELIENGTNGWLFRDEIELKGLIQNLSSYLNKEKYSTLSSSSKKYAEKNFQFQDHVSLIYNELINLI